MKILVVAEIEDRKEISKFMEIEGAYFFLTEEEVIENFIAEQENDR